MKLYSDEIFHVHTHRCGHAAHVPDEEYVKKALELGAKSITFSDHAPFPGNPFTNRMAYDSLDEYIRSLNSLKEQYTGQIEVIVGLEAEYIPSFYDYIKELHERLDILVLGQHHFSPAPGEYIFKYTEETAKCYLPGMVDAMCQGMETGLFEVLAHPDRVFKVFDSWNDDFKFFSEKIINTAIKNNVKLEFNLASASFSLLGKMYSRPEFWKLVPAGIEVICGYDAHNPDEIDVFSGIIRMLHGGMNDNGEN